MSFNIGTKRPLRSRTPTASLRPNRPGPPDYTNRPPWYGTGGNDQHVRAAINERYNAIAATMKVGTNYRCCYCNTPYPLASLEIEHIVPYTTIGLHACNMTELRIVANDVANLTYACGQLGNGCNQSKSDKPLLQFLNEQNITAATFFTRTPWANWMYNAAGAGSMTYLPPWKARAYNVATVSAGYIAAQNADMLNRRTDKTPRRPFNREPCVVDQDNRIIGPQTAVDKILRRINTPELTRDVLRSTSSSSLTDRDYFSYNSISHRLAPNSSVTQAFIESSLLLICHFARQSAGRV